MPEFLKHLLTGKDGETHDLGRWAWLGGFVTVVGHSIWSAAHGVHVSLVELGEALGIVSGAGGAAIGFKAKTEPEPQEKPEVKEYTN